MNLEDSSNKAVSVGCMIKQANYHIDGIRKGEIKRVKQEIYDKTIKYIKIDGYLHQVSIRFKEVNVNDSVLLIFGPIIVNYQSTIGCLIHLHQEMELIVLNMKTGG